VAKFCNKTIVGLKRKCLAGGYGKKERIELILQ